MDIFILYSQLYEGVEGTVKCLPKNLTCLRKFHHQTRQEEFKRFKVYQGLTTTQHIGQQYMSHVPTDKSEIVQKISGAPADKF